MKIFNIMLQISGEIPSNYAKKDTKEREMTTEEKELLTSQKGQLDQLINIAQEQFNISKEDRETYERVFRDADTPEAQKQIADLQELMTGVRPTGKVTTDMLLRDVLIGSTGEIKKATEQFVVQQQDAFDSYKGELTGLSQEFRDTIKNINTEYQTELQSTKESMGTINQDVLSREKGAALGGISSAYDEARKQMQSDLARRGLAGTGVEADAMQRMYTQEAMAKGAADTQARSRALEVSDQIRMQQMGIAGTQYGTGTQAAGALYNQQAGVAGQLYGQQAQINQTGYLQNMAAYQQGISNLQALNAASQGIYVGAGNYLSGASSSAQAGAQIAGSTATSIGSNDVAYQQAQMSQQFGLGDIGALASGVGGFMTGLGKL